MGATDAAIIGATKAARKHYGSYRKSSALRKLSEMKATEAAIVGATEAARKY